MSDDVARQASGPILWPWMLKWLDRYRWLLFGALAVLYGVGFTGQWRIGPDSAQHLSFARILVNGEELAQTQQIHEGLGTGLAYMLAGVSELTGSTDLFSAHLLFLLLGGVALVLSYWLFFLYAGRPTAVVLVAMLALAEGFYRYSFHLLPDLPFMIGGLLCLVGYERLEQQHPGRPGRWASMLLLAMGIVVMALFRSVVLTFVAALVVAAVWQLAQRRRWRQMAGVLALIIVLLLIGRYVDPRNVDPTKLSSDEVMLYAQLVDHLPETLHQMFTNNLRHLLFEVTAEQTFGMDFGPTINLPLGLLVLLYALLLIRVRVLWGLLIIFFLGQWLVFIVADRYFLPIMPLLAIGWWRASVWLENRLGRRWGTVVFVWATLLWCVPNTIRIGDFIREQHQEPFIEHYYEGKYQPIVAAAQWLEDNTPTDSVVLAKPKYHNELSYLSSRLVLGHLFAQARVAPQLYLIAPMQQSVREKIAEQGWTLSDVLVQIPSRPEAREPLTIYQVLRPPGKSITEQNKNQ